MLFLSKIALCLQRCHTACTCSGNSLPPQLILGVAAGKYPLNIGPGAARFSDQVARFIHVKQAFEYAGIRSMADSHKKTSNIQHSLFARLIIAYPDPGYIFTVTQ